LRPNCNTARGFSFCREAKIHIPPRFSTPSRRFPHKALWPRLFLSPKNQPSPCNVVDATKAAIGLRENAIPGAKAGGFEVGLWKWKFRRA
jgi:hypothetical protein